MTGEPRTWREIRAANPDYVDPGQPSGYPDPVPTPARWRRASGLPPAPGSPHQAACTFYLRHVDDDDARLVHGSVAPDGESRRAHAWVEFADGLVWDGLTRRFYEGESYRAALRAEAGHSYSRVEAARLLLRSGHPGPWDDTAGDADRAAAGLDPD
jgi:hypothetical protein